MKNSTITRVVVLGTLAIISIIGVQSYLVWKTRDAKEQEFHEKVNIALRKVADSFAKIKTMPQYDLIERVAYDYYIVNINQVINANSLEYFLKREFQAQGLEEDFHYAIYDCATKQMVGGNLIKGGKYVVSDEEATADLPTYDKYQYYFGVRFPEREGQLLFSLLPTIFMTAILLLAVIFFAYSMAVILRQKRLSEMQKDFINNMTHEFKTPISTIKISSNVFLKDPNIRTDARLTRYANIIKQQNERLNAQVEKVLQIARIEQDSFKLHLEATDLHILLEDCLRSVRLKVDQLGGSLQTDLAENLPTIHADKLHLSNILHNLLDNALKYCKDVPHIQIVTQQLGKYLQLTIADRGIGIPKEYQDKIFEKFYRVPTGNVHNVKGFGLGLFYIKNICSAHGWQIELKSVKRKGTTVEIRIPLGQ
ncbi:MAG: HAMP domain-containing sensor histidine kinase [Bacteroidota bacterium]